MLVDSERVLLELKRKLSSKSHFGQRELYTLIGQLEVEHRIEESLPERALRLYGLEFFSEAVSANRPSSSEGRVSSEDGYQDRALRGDSLNESEEDTHDRSSSAQPDPGDRAPQQGASVTAISGRPRR